MTIREANAWEPMTDVDGRAVGVIGRATLMKNKEAAGRPKDLADVARLKRQPPTRD